MNKQDGRLYHGYIKSVAHHATNSDKYAIQVLDMSQNPHVKSMISYEIFDFLLQPGVGVTDLEGEYVLVRENTSSQLARLLHDDSADMAFPQKFSERKLLYKFDKYTFNDYYKVNMKEVSSILYESLEKDIASPENQLYLREKLQALPLYVLDHFFLHGLLRTSSLSPKDSERIHLASAVYDSVVSSSANGNRKDMQSKRDLLYDVYQKVVIDKNKMYTKSMFDGYASVIKTEIYNQSNQTSFFQQSIKEKYEKLSDMVKYYMFPDALEYPYDQKTVSYIMCLYFMQEIWKKYSEDPSFVYKLNTLVDVAEHHYYRGIVPNVYPDDDEKAHIPLIDLHIYDIFHVTKGVHITLESWFTSMYDRIQAGYERGQYRHAKYLDVVSRELENKFDKSFDKLHRFFYCVYLMDCLNEKVIANKR